MDKSKVVTTCPKCGEKNEVMVYSLNAESAMETVVTPCKKCGATLPATDVRKR